MSGAINSYRDSLQEVDGLDLQIHLVRGSDGTYAVDDERKRRKKSETRVKFTGTKPVTSILDKTAKFAAEY